MAPELVELGLGLIVLGLLFGAWVMRGASAASFGWWPLAWAIMVGEGGVRAIYDASPVYHLTSALTAACFLAGAHRYSGVPLPRWLVPAIAGVGLVYQSFYSLGATGLAAAIGFVVEPTVIAASGVLILRQANAPFDSRVHALLPYTFFAIAGMDVYDFFFLSEGIDSFTPWLLVSIPAATIQVMANFDRIRGRAAEVENELARSVSLLQATLESTADGILVVDREGHYSSFNRMFGEMWHIPGSVLEQRDSEMTLAYATPQLVDPDAFYRKVQDLYAHPDDESFDTLEFKDGRVFERYSRPQRVGNEIVGRVWSFRDVSERKHAETTAERYRDHLEDLVEERTRELLESRDQLRNADRLAAVGTLAAGVAHQINNPVGSILNSAEYALLCENDDDAMETWKRALEVNAHEAKRCAAIVRSMLQFAREEPVTHRIEDLNRVIQRAARAVTGYARDRTAQLDVSIDDEPLWVEMSSIELEQVFVNLLRNGIESRDLGANVMIRVARKEGEEALDGGRCVRVEVIDDGRGIPADQANRIFDPFFSTRVHEGGTGLGLSVAHGIVAGHGGEISVQSKPGEGSRIVVVLPLRDDPEAPTDATQGTQA